MRDTINYKIEDFTAGFLSGWYYDSTSPTDGSVFQVEANDRVITIGTADLFREDLLKVGFGNGKHAFRVFIEDKLFGFGKLALRLKDENGSIISGDTFSIERLAPSLNIELVNQDSLNLIFKCLSTNDTRRFRLQLSAGNEIVHYQNVQINAGQTQLTWST